MISPIELTSNVGVVSEIVVNPNGANNDKRAWGWCTRPLFAGQNQNSILTPNSSALARTPYAQNDTSLPIILAE